jgi:hypothetical protein
VKAKGTRLKIFLLFFIVVLDGSAMEYLQRFLQCIKYIRLEFTPSTASGLKIFIGKNLSYRLY